MSGVEDGENILKLSIISLTALLFLIVFLYYYDWSLTVFSIPSLSYVGQTNYNADRVELTLVQIPNPKIMTTKGF